jgi:hypothetical protein
MLHVYECVRESGAPWSLGDRVAYAPFDFRQCVVLLATDGARSFGTEVIPLVHRDAFNGTLVHLYDQVDDADIDSLTRDVEGR